MRHLLLFTALTFQAQAWTLISHTSVVGSTTPAIITTGADLIVVTTVPDNGATITDSKSNTWTALTAQNATVRIYYVHNPTVGSGHTFSATAGNGVIMVEAWAGSITSPFDQQNGGFTASLVTTFQVGSITPGVSTELVVTGIGLGGNASSPTIDSGMTVSDSQNGVSGVSYGGGMAYIVQSAATPINPTWSWTNTTGPAAVIASFKGLGASGGPSVTLGLP